LDDKRRLQRAADTRPNSYSFLAGAAL